MALTIETEHLIIGSGIAGLMLAHKLGQFSKVTVIAKGSLLDNNTRYAQGGIASVMGPEDSFEQHIEDTLEAGAGLCHRDIVRMVVEKGPALINELIELGVDFTRAKDGTLDQPYHLTREGGHSARRIIHAHDLTGQEVLRALIEAVTHNPNIQVFDGMFAVDLLTTDKYRPQFGSNSCLGAYVFDNKHNQIIQFRAQATFLCTGGHGKVYLYTSNPDVATGDGLSMGWRAGCKVANLEFMQFHPTCLYSQKAKNFLISEAVRGEGAVLKDAQGQPFMHKYSPLESLAPRDVVARAVDREIKKSGLPFVYLDARSLGAEKIRSHFPNIHKVCLEQGIDMTKEMIPVVPAAHFSCGGLATDSWGRTTVNNLYAVGEVACTGLHGANRLASNSLLEALVFSDRVSHHVQNFGLPPLPETKVPDWNSAGTIPTDELVVLTHTWDEIRRIMWNYVGIVRTEKRLQRAFDKINAIRNELQSYYWEHQIDTSLLEVRNLADVAFLTIRCAMKRKESRGIHYNLDYLEIDNTQEPLDTLIW
ncbi:L-aspartate oxidase [Oligoflexus tunisiensis]|uniref:L-aspartate oxidase n=1 Tax=Oligoflexus tunisiensis TaxID=708132 RepID=UPI000B1B2EB9|nr:L-aspartate oxidase [Oligoflexus tunisiensis]